MSSNGNKILRRALLKKLKIANSTLSNLLRPLKEEFALSSEQALWTLAAQSGIQLNSYLEKDQLANAQNTINMVRLGKSAVLPTPAPTATTKTAKPLRTNEITIKLPSGKFYKDSGLSDAVLKQAAEMAKHYPVFYLLENSIRALFAEVMKDEHGENWWKANFKSGTAKNAKEAAEKRRSDPDTHKRWHQSGGDHPLDFATLEGLSSLMQSQVDLLFPKKLGITLDWFRNFMEEMATIRNVFCHMNPLDTTSIKNLILRNEQWQKICHKYREAN